MLNPYRCIRKDDSELTDLQRNLDKFLDREYDRISRRCDELMGGENLEEFYSLILQMIEITKIRNRAGIIEIKDERTWWHT